MEFAEYPKWKYSADGALIVDDAEAEEALGDGWHDAPLDAAEEVLIDPTSRRGRPRKDS